MKQLPKNAEDVMVRRYAMRNEKGEPAESPAEILERTARVVAEAENNYRDGVKPKEVEEKFAQLLKDFRFVPNGRTLANAGSSHGQLANCFVLPLDDELGKTEDGIFSILRKAVLVLQSGGGVGFSFGRIRPQGDTAGRGKATGAVSFLKVFDTAFWIIGQGGGRRSACMAVLPVTHPDIYNFIHCKEQEGVIEHFNISVGITDEFMKAVEKDGKFDLINPRNQKVWRTVAAKELFKEIVKFAHHNGEPGVLFLDAANRQNPVPNQYYLEATNPCVARGTLVATPRGWLKVEDIHSGDDVCTVLGVGKIDAIEVNENVPVFKLKFSDGNTIRATAAHQFHVRDAQTKFFHPVRVDELSTGQFVRIFRSSVPNNIPKSSNTDLSDRDFGFLIGVLVGDGCYTSKRLAVNVVRISSHDQENEWNQLLEDKFKLIGITRMYKYVNKNSHSLMMDPKPGKVVSEWVKSTLLKPAASYEKEIPEDYINSNRDFLLGLLDGLFSTDGSVDLSSNHPLIRFHTSSNKLALQVRLILLMFGIHGRVFTTYRKEHDIGGRVIRNDRPKYDVIISGESFGRFYEQINLSNPDKQDRLRKAALGCNFTGGNWAAQIISIEPDGIDKVYDLHEPNSDSWITEGYVSRGCGEQFLGPYENCCMASINLAEHTKLKSDKRQAKSEKLFNKEIDWEKLRETTEWTVRWLDDVVDANDYVPVVPELAEAAYRNRRIGVSIMGLADLMYQVGVRYGSPHGVDLAGQVMEFIRYHAMTQSVKLAKERGAFPGIVGSVYDYQTQSSNVKTQKWEVPKPIKPYEHEFGRPTLDWKSLLVDLKKFGIRNSCQTTIQPTGAIATIAGIEGYGCEPVFALSYVMKTHEGADEKGDGVWAELFYESKLFMQVLEKAGLDDKTRETIFTAVRSNGSCQDVELVPEAIRDVFVVSSDVTVEEHVAMQASMQVFVDNAISKTINFPEGATEEQVYQAYFKGWKMGLKGMTVYVTGSRKTVVLETQATSDRRQATGFEQQELQKGMEPFTNNGNGIIGKPLHKVHPQDLTCAECGATMILQEGCATCPQCGSTHCSI